MDTEINVEGRQILEINKCGGWNKRGGWAYFKHGGVIKFVEGGKIKEKNKCGSMFIRDKRAL